MFPILQSIFRKHFSCFNNILSKLIFSTYKRLVVSKIIERVKGQKINKDYSFVESGNKNISKYKIYKKLRRKRCEINTFIEHFIKNKFMKG